MPATAPVQPLLAPPRRQEIDHRTIKLIVGVIALSLAGLTNALAPAALESISAAYYAGGWAQTIFIGFLFAIAAFLLAYNGATPTEMLLSKIAAVAALGVALFPCQCGTHDEIIRYVHSASAALMFGILAFFCYGFYWRATLKGHGQARARAAIYAVCGVVILAAIIALAVDGLSGGVLSARVPRLTFFGEAMALVAFGVSWLTASRVMPLMTREDERFSPFRASNPD